MKYANKIVTILGARPQFIKAISLTKAFQNNLIKEIIVHTGQHYDYEMSKIFFETFNIPEPDYNLKIGSLSHGAQTGRMLEKVEEVLVKEKPAGVVVYGDTNSTLAGALAAVKLKIPVFHIEAGLRSFNRNMPEEINRVLTDHMSSLLFAPTEEAVKNMKNEGLTKGIVKTGDVMYDTFQMFKSRYKKHSQALLCKYGVKKKEFGVVTVHREENTNDLGRFNSIIGGLKLILKDGIKLIFPAHPRIKNIVPQNIENLIITEPLSYFNIQALLSQALVVLTDSGGLQKEAYFHKVPCLTLRDETEWIELQRCGANMVCGAKPENILKAFKSILKKEIYFNEKMYGDGKSGIHISNTIKLFLKEIK